MYDIKNFMYVYVFAVVTEVSHLKHNLLLREEISIYEHYSIIKNHSSGNSQNNLKYVRRREEEETFKYKESIEHEIR